MEYQSVNFNGAKTELGIAAGSGGDDAQGVLETQIGGAVVREYDTQIREYTAELTAANEEKEALREDKTSLTGMLGSVKDIAEDDGYTFTDGEAGTIAFTGEAYLMKSAEYQRFAELAEEYGVELNGIGVKGSQRAVPEGIIEAVREEIENRISDLNSQSELKLIRYQSLMDARKQSLMLLSNLINSDNQTRLAVIQNMKG